MPTYDTDDYDTLTPDEIATLDEWLVEVLGRPVHAKPPIMECVVADGRSTFVFYDEHGEIKGDTLPTTRVTVDGVPPVWSSAG